MQFDGGVCVLQAPLYQVLHHCQLTPANTSMTSSPTTSSVSLFFLFLITEVVLVFYRGSTSTPVFQETNCTWLFSITPLPLDSHILSPRVELICAVCWHMQLHCTNTVSLSSKQALWGKSKAVLGSQTCPSSALDSMLNQLSYVPPPPPPPPNLNVDCNTAESNSGYWNDRHGVGGWWVRLHSAMQVNRWNSWRVSTWELLMSQVGPWAAVRHTTMKCCKFNLHRETARKRPIPYVTTGLSLTNSCIAAHILHVQPASSSSTHARTHTHTHTHKHTHTHTLTNTHTLTHTHKHTHKHSHTHTHTYTLTHPHPPTHSLTHTHTHTHSHTHTPISKETSETWPDDGEVPLSERGQHLQRFQPDRQWLQSSATPILTSGPTARAGLGQDVLHAQLHQPGCLVHLRLKKLEEEWGGGYTSQSTVSKPRWLQQSPN